MLRLPKIDIGHADFDAKKRCAAGMGIVVLSGLLGVALPSFAARQDQQKPAPAPDSQKSQPQESSSKRNVDPPPSQPAFNPLPAEKDVEVGTFYMRKGDMDAAIPRFEDAIALRPEYAKPRLLLGQAYEKKHDKEQAVKYYKEYLRVFPTAPDAKEVQKKIEKLSH